MDKLKMQTENIADKNFEMLSKMFPNALTETITGCARCTGVIISYFLALILFKKYKVPWQLCIIMAGIMLTDWSLQYFGIKESTNSRRFVTGLIGGFGLNTLKLKIL